MIKVIRSGERYRYQGDWLDTYWHFSFDHYNDPANVHWGALRVFNDDFIKPASGFPHHPHRDMEIVTYVISGELTHQDSLGNAGTIAAGEIQRMTAGTGIIHSEANRSPDQELHQLQMWVLPERHGLEPSWEQKRFTPEERRGKLLPVVSGRSVDGALQIHQDATFLISSLDAGAKVDYALGEGRHAYLFVVDGEITLNGETLHKGDQARIKDEASLTVQAAAPAELVLWDTI